MGRLQQITEGLKDLLDGRGEDQPVKVTLTKEEWMKIIGSISPAIEGSISEKGIEELTSLISKIQEQIPAFGD